MRVLAVATAVAVGIVGGTVALPACGTPARIDADVGKSLLGRFSVNRTCTDGDLLIYRKQSGSQRLQVNARGEYLYAAPASETAERFAVVASCGTQNDLCELSVAVSVARPLTLAPTPSPDDEPRECPQLFFPVTLGQALSDSLASARDSLPCSGTRTYRITDQASRGQGQPVLATNGDFRYDAPSTVASGNQYDDFGYAMSCDGAELCRGRVYLTFMATPPSTPSPTVPPTPQAPGSQPSQPTPETDAPSANQDFVQPRPHMQCRGTCNRGTWKAAQGDSNAWDTTQNIQRADGKPAEGVEATWADGKLVLKAYSVIGNLGIRFPAFEQIALQVGDMLSDTELRERIASSSVPFDIDCLGMQSAAGLAANVWEWDSVINRTGHVGRHYASGSDWYQKFGGKHVNCDTFLQDSCHYAPLLTPRAQQDANSGGKWSITIDGCDVTWTGEFTFAALRNMRRADGTAAFSMEAGHRLKTGIVTQAVKPISEVRPAAGVATNVVNREMVLDLEPWTTATVESSARDLFSVDSEFYQYFTADGERAFGLNLLVYPHIEDDRPEVGASSYRPDRHVAGFRWVEQEWTHPDNLQCPGCSGADMACSVDTSMLDSDASFLADQLMEGNCRNPRVKLGLGPSFTAEDCPPSRMHNYGRNGFSAPRYCRRSFQNITIRGIAPGSDASGASFAFEGSIRLQLLMDNGQKPFVDVQLGMVVGMSTVDGNFAGTSDVCRGGAYWPVFDPLGSSLPDQPHPLSEIVEHPAELCIDRDDRTFGPSGWALVTFDVEGASYKNVRLESLSLTYAGAPEVVLAISDAARALPAGAVWWHEQMPFLNFRDLSDRLPNQTFSVSRDVDPITGQDYAFAFTPGAIGVTTDVTVTCVLRVSGGNGTKRVTFTRMLHTDAALSAASRFGPPVLIVNEGEIEPHSQVMAMAASGGLLAALLFVCIIAAFADTKQPLPKWMPRNLVPVKRQSASDDQNKRATVGGIPVQA